MPVAHPSPTIAAPDLEGAVDALKRNGLRLTLARRLLIERLLAAERPLAAPDLAARVGAPNDVAAVYRNLDVLEQIGLVRHIHAGHGPALYTLADRVASEYLTCEGCGELVAVRSSVLEPARAEIRRATGFEVRFVHFPLLGRCPQCQ